MIDNKLSLLDCINTSAGSRDPARSQAALTRAAMVGASDAGSAQLVSPSRPPWPNQLFTEQATPAPLHNAVVARPAVPARSLPPAQSRPAAVQAVKLAKVAAYVDGMLWRSDLTVATIAVDVGISRSALYRHFESLGGVARFVRDRRMAALRHALDRPDEGRAFAAVARDCGFASASHASRRFKARYGLTPSAFRHLAREAAAG